MCKDETRQAGAETEIVVTPDMVEAGVGEFLKSYPDTGTGDQLDADMVTAIYRAMAASRFSGTGSQLRGLDD